MCLQCSLHYPNLKLKSCNSETVGCAESLGEVVLEAALHMDHMHLQGEGLVVVGVLRAPGIVLAPVIVELEDLVFL